MTLIREPFWVMIISHEHRLQSPCFSLYVWSQVQLRILRGSWQFSIPYPFHGWWGLWGMRLEVMEVCREKHQGKRQRVTFAALSSGPYECVYDVMIAADKEFQTVRSVVQASRPGLEDVLRHPHSLPLSRLLLACPSQQRQTRSLSCI